MAYRIEHCFWLFRVNVLFTDVAIIVNITEKNYWVILTLIWLHEFQYDISNTYHNEE